ncbi:MAG: glycosyltransferase [Planctomycetes bacterium]|nr:glycosyltransferase [Planctomycetota bacterium]
MIVLLEPTRPVGFVSGGYHYQAQVAQQLAAAGTGRLLACAPAALAATVAQLRRDPDALVVVDGLFAEHAPLPPGVVALLHCVPSRADWCEGRVPVVATAATTAGAARVAVQAAAIEVVRPGLERLFAPVAHRANLPLRVLMVGTVTPAKGQERVARTLRELADRCGLTLVGDHATEPHHTAAVRAAAGTLAIEWAGVQPPAAVAAAMQRCDLFVSASRSESFGMAVAEAAACGAPVLAFATGEIATFVQHGSNGWLVPLGDEAGFAALLRLLLRDPTWLARARSHARRPDLADWPTTARSFAAACHRLNAVAAPRNGG